MTIEIGILRKKLLQEVDELSASIKNKRQILDLLVKECVHQYEEADDLYNYHKRVSYERCIHCGDVI